MRIVLDAMGTDDCPGPDVHGGILAAQELSVSVVLVGDESAIKRELAKHPTAGLDIEIVHAAQAITMYDKPSVVTKGKPASSMHVGMNLVKSGHGDAFVTMGNTGAAHAIAVCNGTVALHLALHVLGLGPGDEVIVPSFTYIASVNTIAQTGATPVFAESRRSDWLIDVEDEPSCL